MASEDEWRPDVPKVPTYHRRKTTTIQLIPIHYTHYALPACSNKTLCSRTVQTSPLCSRRSLVQATCLPLLP